MSEDIETSSSDLSIVKKPVPIDLKECSVTITERNESDSFKMKKGPSSSAAEDDPPLFGGLFAGWKASKQEFITSMKLVGPIMLSNIIGLGNNMINIAFLGKVGTNELSAAALGVMLVNVTGNSFVAGFCTALDTLCSQAHGANASRRVGVLLNRGLFVVTVLAVVVAFVWGFAIQSLLEALGQEHVVALLAQIFTRYMLIGILPLFWFEAVRRTLASIGVAYPQALASAISVITVVLCELLFVNALNLGVKGSAIALSLGYWAQFISCLLIAQTSPEWRKHTTRFTPEMFQELGQFFKLAIPGTVMVCAEWWAYEIAQIIAGVISASTLSALSILLQISGVLFQIPFSFATACSSRVGNNLGNGDALLARTSCAMLFGASSLCEIIYLTIFFAVGPYVGKIFSDDPEVLRTLEDACVYCALVCLFDGCQGCLSGILRGVGSQTFGAVVNLISFYVVGLPLEFVFVYTVRPLLQSIYLGLIASPTFQDCLFIGHILSLNWEQLAIEVSARERRFKEANLNMVTLQNAHVMPLQITIEEDEEWGETIVADVTPTPMYD